jgi:hypothetical protein
MPNVYFREPKHQYHGILHPASELNRLLPDVPIALFTQHGDLGKHLLGSGFPFDRIVSKTTSTRLARHVESLIPV